MKLPLTIIIPARREEIAITKTLDALACFVKTPHKIIIVNDSDPLDRTADTVTSYMRNHKHISLIKRVNPHATFGSALQLGCEAVKNGAILPVMADLCDDVTSIDTMYALLLNGWDIVCGSRYMKNGQKIGGPMLQSLGSKAVCLSLQKITGIPTHDVSNAFKMYRVAVIKDIGFCQTSGVEASMELTLQAFFQNYRIAEIPTVWHDRTLGKSKFNLLDRTPRYSSVYCWAVYNAIRRQINLPTVKRQSFI